MATVFISHTGADNPFVARLAKDLRARGVDAFVAEVELDVGTDIRRGVETAIAERDYFVVVLSAAALRSAWVQQELSAAFAREIREERALILPVLLDDIVLPPLLAGRNCADFRREYCLGLERLLDLFGANVELKEARFPSGAVLHSIRRPPGAGPQTAVTLAYALDDWCLALILASVGPPAAARQVTQSVASGLRDPRLLSAMFGRGIKGREEELLIGIIGLGNLLAKSARLDLRLSPDVAVGTKVSALLRNKEAMHVIWVGQCGGMFRTRAEAGGWMVHVVRPPSRYTIESPPHRSLGAIVDGPLGHIDLAASQFCVEGVSSPSPDDFALLTSFDLPSDDEGWNELTDDVGRSSTPQAALTRALQCCQPKASDGVALLVNWTPT